MDLVLKRLNNSFLLSLLSTPLAKQDIIVPVDEVFVRFAGPLSPVKVLLMCC